VLGDPSFVLESPNLVDHGVLVVRTGMPGNVLIFQPWIVRSIEEAMDLIGHAAERMPADLSLQAQAVKADQISDVMAEDTSPMLFNDSDFDSIGSFHLFSLGERVENCAPLLFNLYGL
jgi:hypothetical protein